MVAGTHNEDQVPCPIVYEEEYPKLIIFRLHEVGSFSNFGQLENIVMSTSSRFGKRWPGVELNEWASWVHKWELIYSCTGYYCRGHLWTPDDRERGR